MVFIHIPDHLVEKCSELLVAFNLLNIRDSHLDGEALDDLIQGLEVLINFLLNQIRIWEQVFVLVGEGLVLDEGVDQALVVAVGELPPVLFQVRVVPEVEVRFLVPDPQGLQPFLAPQCSTCARVRRA